MKTARFSSMVDQAGEPAPYLLLVAPDQDATLQKFIKEQRVMTVHQDVRGTRKDYGTVEFVREPEAQYLVFPRTLRKFAGRRIIGIDYQRLAADARLPERAPAPRPRAKSGAPTKPPPATRPSPQPQARAEPTVSAPVPADEKLAPASTRSRSAQSAKPQKQKAAPSRNGAPPPAPPERNHIIRELRQGVRELKAGKAVAAYERLQALLAELEP